MRVINTNKHIISMAHLNAKPDRQRKRYDDQEHGEANHEVAQTAPFD